MNFKEFAESRKSVRGFLDKPVPKELVDEIIDAAKFFKIHNNIFLFFLILAYFSIF